MEDDKIKIKIKYNDEIKSIDFPYTLEDLTIDFKKIFNIKGNKYFNFSYTVNRFIHNGNFEKEIRVLKERQNPIIFAEDSCKEFLELLNNKSTDTKKDEQEDKGNLSLIEEDDIFNKGQTVLTVNVDEENNIEEKKDKVDLKENMSSLENEIKKTKEQIDNEINNVNILKEEIDFLNDISKEKIPMQYIKLKNKVEKLEKENEQKSNEVKEYNKLKDENFRLKKIIEEKNNTIKNMEKSYKKAINELKDNFIKQLKKLEENSTSI